jgi:hypothetical protein
MDLEIQVSMRRYVLPPRSSFFEADKLWTFDFKTGQRLSAYWSDCLKWKSRIAGIRRAIQMPQAVTMQIAADLDRRDSAPMIASGVLGCTPVVIIRYCAPRQQVFTL